MLDFFPAQYDHPAQNMIVRIMPRRDIERLCGYALRSYGTALGCAIPLPNMCIVFLPPNASRALYRHERAHCNGWKH